MKIFLFSLIIILLAITIGCTSFDLLGPNEDPVLLNVQIHFDFLSQVVEIENRNWNSARVQLSRYTSGNYLEIFDVNISGNKKKTISCAFDHGDEIRFRVRIRDDEGNLIDESIYIKLS